MSSKYELFKPLIHSLLQTNSEEEEVAIATSLALQYQSHLKGSIGSEVYSDTHPTHLDGGIALSSQHALDCLQDPLRTIRFIKATHQAILECFNRFPNEQIELVYAGCGPAASIIVPLLCLFVPSQLSITLLDINKTSIDAVNATIDALGAQDFFRGILLEDAIKYQHPEHLPLHMVLSETMDKALTKEPQVSITQNLAPQIHEHGIFIPEAITIFTEYSFYSKEPYFDIYKNVLELGPKIETRDKQPLFSITKDNQINSELEFTSASIEVPKNFEDTPDICIYAELLIFDKQELKKAQSQISNSYCVTSLYNLNGTSYKLTYTIKDIPKWDYLDITI